MASKTQEPSHQRNHGLDSAIDRRDFLNGVAFGAATLSGGLASPAPAAAAPLMQDHPDYYPPTLNGLRGSHEGSFEAAHNLRDGKFWDHAEKPEDTIAVYDLIVVGAGISGLSTAHFFRAAKPNARILILDNHDDFGGHAKRNEFHLAGHLELLNGGTQLIDSPHPYSPAAAELLKYLGIEPVALAKRCDKPDIYKGLAPATFFDKETFGADRLVVGRARGEEEGEISWKEFLAKAPLSPRTQADILRIEEGKVDYFPGLTSAQKKDRLSRINYRDYLEKVAKVDAVTLAFYQTITHDEWGIGIDAEPALDCWGFGLPGFDGLKLEKGSIQRMGYTAAGYEDDPELPTFHFPDGNATIARLLVRDLIPKAIPGHTVEDVVTAHANYAELNRAGSPVAIRLSSTVVGVRNIGDAKASRGVEVAYARGGRVFRVHGANCVLAGWNMMIPFLCPELPDAQKTALRELVKVPLVYASVALKNWRAFHKLGVQSISSPQGYFTAVRLNFPVDIGGYKSMRSPDDPILLFLVRAPVVPGLKERDQHRLGRVELLATPFDTFERNIRDQLARMLVGTEFDAAKDILAITINRWPHGYAYEFNPLFDDFNLPPEKWPNVVGRKPFGRIFIANSDSGARAYTDSAIDQARRAVDEILSV